MNAPPPPDQQLVPLALEICDAVMVIATPGWRAVDLTLARNEAGALRIAALDTTLGPDGAAPRPALGVEPGAMYGVLHEALDDLARAAAAVGWAWPAARARLRRDDDARFALELCDASGTALHAVTPPGEALAARVFTDALFAALREADVALARTQSLFEREVETHEGWEYDPEPGVLTVQRPGDDVARFPADVLGTFAHESESWLWAWANPALDPRRAATASRLREWARGVPGLGALLRPALSCGEGFADALAGLAASRGGARGVFRGVYDGGILYLAAR